MSSLVVGNNFSQTENKNQILQFRIELTGTDIDIDKNNLVYFQFTFQIYSPFYIIYIKTNKNILYKKFDYTRILIYCTKNNLKMLAND